MTSRGPEAAFRQITLDLGHRPALGREDFLVSPCNEVAVAWIDRWPAWSAPALAIFGPQDCGKSHLGQVWQAASDAVAVTAQDIAKPDLPAQLLNCDAVLIDAAAALLAAHPEAQRNLLHLYNSLVERKGYLLFTDRDPPARWACGLPDLRSRISAIPAIEMREPDDGLLEAVLVKLFADRQLHVDRRVVAHLVPRIERSFRAAQEIVAALDRHALTAQRRLTVPLVKQVLESAEFADKS